MGDTKPVGDVAQERLQEYAEAYRVWKNGGGVKPEHVEDLECALIQDLTANATHADVDRSALMVLGAVDELHRLAETHADTLARVAAENGAGSGPKEDS